jgi:hypothetical protein
VINPGDATDDRVRRSRSQRSSESTSSPLALPGAGPLQNAKPAPSRVQWRRRQPTEACRGPAPTSATWFIWLDDNTPRQVSLPFTTLVAADAVNFALPARVPVLPSPITDLWVVHERTRRGWRWSATTGWQGVAGGER